MGQPLRAPSRSRFVAGRAVVVLAVALSGCTGGKEPGASSRSTATTVAEGRGGSVRVAVWADPDPDSATLVGSGTRALVLPQLFVAQPDGSWSPQLVVPGSARAGGDRLSASFRLRPGATWSDGRPVTADDLRRTADARFVAGVDGPSPDGVVTVRFTHPLADWQRLWSGVDSIAAPGPGVWGGPFVVASVTPGFETVVRRNDRWVGARPHLDEVRLLLVNDPTTARQLLERNEVDVVMTPAATVRTRQLRRLHGVTVATTRRSGWWVGMFLAADRLPLARRTALVGTVDRRRFVDTLLENEAEELGGLAGNADTTWSGPGPPDAEALRGGPPIDLVGEIEEPMTGLLERALQKRAAPTRLELRNAESARVENWLREGSFDAAIAMAYDGPTVCWTCRWGTVDAARAAAADGGDRAAALALESKVRDSALALPLWRSFVTVAWRAAAVRGVRVNGYSLNAAWNAWEWSTP